MVKHPDRTNSSHSGKILVKTIQNQEVITLVGLNHITLKK